MLILIKQSGSPSFKMLNKKEANGWPILCHKLILFYFTFWNTTFKELNCTLKLLRACTTFNFLSN